MKIHRHLVTPAKPIDFDEDLDYSTFDFGKSYPLLGLSDVHVNGRFFLDGEQLMCAIALTGIMKLSDSRTLEPFDLPFDYEDEFALLQNAEEEGDGYIFPERVIELSDVAFCCIHTHMPLCAHKPDSEVPSGVMTEEEAEALGKENPFNAISDDEVLS